MPFLINDFHFQLHHAGFACLISPLVSPGAVPLPARLFKEYRAEVSLFQRILQSRFLYLGILRQRDCKRVLLSTSEDRFCPAIQGANNRSGLGERSGFHFDLDLRFIGLAHLQILARLFRVDGQQTADGRMPVFPEDNLARSFKPVINQPLFRDDLAGLFDVMDFGETFLVKHFYPSSFALQDQVLTQLAVVLVTLIHKISNPRLGRFDLQKNLYR